MDKNNMTNIFLPSHISVRPRCILLGIVQKFTCYTVISCISSLSCNEDECAEKVSELCCRAISNSVLSDINVVGFINDVASRHRSANIPNCFSKDIYFVLYVDSESSNLSVERIEVKNHHPEQIRIIIYSATDIVLSYLVQNIEKSSWEKSETTQMMNFSNFIKCTAAATVPTTESLCSRNACSSSYIIEKVFSWVSTHFYKVILSIALKYEYVYRISVARFPEVSSKVIQLSSVGRHVQRRLHHVHQLTSSVSKGKDLPLSCGNLISAIVFDILCGWIFTYLFWNLCSPTVLLQIALEYTNIVVNKLQLILHWLMGVPAGLKLNVPLNTALGHFFLYHIYLWKTYMTVVRPLFSIVLEGVAILGIFGLTFIICLLNDLLSMATIHIYCFYGYAARLYGYQMAGLAASWRLFRGKKWNPLRQRIDSYTYNFQQLYVGTVFFTVLAFLLPTVMAYYVVFTTLRIAVLTVQGFITRSVNLLSIFPVYVIILRMCNSKLTTGDVYFTVLQEWKVLVLNMQLVQIPLQSVIQRTLPEDVCKEEPLSWKMFWNSLIWGKIIYPM